MTDRITPAYCKAMGYSCTAWCSRCGYGRNLDLLAYEVAGTANVPWAEIVPRLRCKSRARKCGAPAHSITISRMEVGRVVPVCTIGPLVPVVGKLQEGGEVQMMERPKKP